MPVRDPGATAAREAHADARRGHADGAPQGGREGELVAAPAVSANVDGTSCTLSGCARRYVMTRVRTLAPEVAVTSKRPVAKRNGDGVRASRAYARRSHDAERPLARYQRVA